MSGTPINPDTGYPNGYIPSWWACPKCDLRFHDSQQKGDPGLNWSNSVPCGNCRIDMVRYEGPGILGSCPHCCEVIIEGTMS